MASNIFHREMEEEDVLLSENEESIVEIERFKGKGRCISQITSRRDCDIVITGVSSKDQSHITVVNRRGEIQRRDIIKRVKKHDVWPYRYCCYLSESKVATACFPDEVGIYDVLDGSYSKKIISEVVDSWSPNISVWCITTDPVNDHIIVGTNSRYLYVFDDHLDYCHTIRLPNEIKRSGNITVNRDSILICDYSGKSAHAIKMEGSESRLMYEFTNPDLGGTSWRPRSVCTDKYELIYMLWTAFISNHFKYILVQYSRDGQRVLSTREVALNAWCLDALELDGYDKILIATSMDLLYEYGLKVTSTNRR